MDLYVKIITDDKRFERMLSLELSDRGVEIVGETSLNSRNLTKKNFYTLVDLDFCSEDDIADLLTYSSVIGFSHSYMDANSRILGSCYAILHRPFLMDELFSVIFNEGIRSPLPKSASIPKRSSKKFKDKTGYLKVEESSKKAIWGNEGIALTDNEYKVLSLLCERRGETVTRGEISELLGATDGNISDVYICMLRRKIDNRFGVKLIYTVRGEGYVLKN